MSVPILKTETKDIFLADKKDLRPLEERGAKFQSKLKNLSLKNF